MFRHTSDRARFCLLASAVFALGGSLLLAQDPPAEEEEPVRLYGSAGLAPPGGEGDASGMVHVFQRDERMALHVRVRRLEPGQTYDVVATLGEGDAQASETIGTITTREEIPSVLPRCFKAVLRAPPEEEPPEEPPAGGEKCDPGRPGCRPGEPSGPGGLAVLYVNRDYTEAAYCIYVRGLSGELTAVIHLGEGADDIVLESLRGTLAVDEALLQTMASGAASVEVTGDEGSVSGAIESCFSWLDMLRDMWMSRRVGTGALRLDTAREDVMPFGVETIADLAGMTIDVVKNEEGAESVVVLTGVLAEIRELGTWNPHDDGHHHKGASSSKDGTAPDESEDDLLFTIGETHDARISRGDVNDDGMLDISDPISLLLHLFRGSFTPYCLDAGDANDDGVLNLTDSIVMLQNLFQGADTMSRPYPGRGFDRTPDLLFCDE